jgi:hypothetical protein
VNSVSRVPVRSEREAEVTMVMAVYEVAVVLEGVEGIEVLMIWVYIDTTVWVVTVFALV